MAKSVTKKCNSNVTVYRIVTRYGKLNENVRSVNRLLQTHYRYMNIRFVGHEDINATEHLNYSGLHLNHLDTPIKLLIF